MADQAANSRLGRGLAALMGEVGAESASEDRPRGQRQVPVAFLRPNPLNPRKEFADDDLADLTNSVRQKGVVQPLLVRPVAGTTDTFEIIAGERRWRAAQKVGLHEVPVVVREVSDRESLELAIIENVQRSDLNALEEATGYRQLLEEHQYTQGELAQVIGKSRPHISNTLRLLKLPAEVQGYLKAGKLSAGHARALVTHDNPIAAARLIIRSGLSVRDVEAIEGAGKKPARKKIAPVKDADTRALEKTVGDRLGLVVSIDHGEAGGSVRIKYRSLEQLDEICRRLRTS
jgi:ParB family chromosome partitioning protein